MSEPTVVVVAGEAEEPGLSTTQEIVATASIASVAAATQAQEAAQHAEAAAEETATEVDLLRAEIAELKTQAILQAERTAIVADGLEVMEAEASLADSSLETTAEPVEVEPIAQEATNENAPKRQAHPVIRAFLGRM